MIVASENTAAGKVVVHYGIATPAPVSKTQASSSRAIAAERRRPKDWKNGKSVNAAQCFDFYPSSNDAREATRLLEPCSIYC